MAKWEAFLMEHQGENIVGKQVWVTDTRLSDNTGDTRVRSVPPTLVQIESNKNLPKNVSVYYSSYHFRKVSKTGKVLKQIIKPFDNTGYRSYSGVSLHVFETEAEAVECHHRQLDEIVEQLENVKRDIDRKIEQTLLEKGGN